MPQLDIPDIAQALPAPSIEECMALWDKYAMLANIREHSMLVAKIAHAIAQKAETLGIAINARACLASGLLHDLAKTWCLKNGGNHDMIGASWTAQETQNYEVAQGVILHVHWPWSLPEGESICRLPILVMYADKRARHNQCVTLKERFEDLLARYGKTEAARQGIRESFRQSQEIERELSKLLGWNLDEYTFDSGRLVNRA